MSRLLSFYLSIFIFASSNLHAVPYLPKRAAVGIYVLGPKELIVGTQVSYRISLHWANSPKTTGPLPHAKVKLSLVSSKNKIIRVLTRGKSDVNGDLKIRFIVPSLKKDKYKLRVDARSTLGRSRESFDVNLIAGGKILLTTDKPLYRPGQRIHIRALALRSIDRKPLFNEIIRWKIYDPAGNKIFSSINKTSAFGIASTSFDLADEIIIGDYRIEALLANDADSDIQNSKVINISRYQLPSFNIDLKTNHQSYRPEEILQGKLSATYFFGKAVPNAKIRLTLAVKNCSKLANELRCKDENPVHLYSQTDENGNARFRFKLPKGRIGICDEGELKLTADVYDGSGEKRSTTIVRPFSELKLQIAMVVPNGSLVRKLPNRIYILVADLWGRPVKYARVLVEALGTRFPLISDDLGIAILTDFVHSDKTSCTIHGKKGIAFKIQANHGLRYRGTYHECIPFNKDKLVLRTTTPLVRPGQSLKVMIRSNDANSGESAYLDLIRKNQSIISLSAPFQKNVATFSIPTDRPLSGFVALHGYRILSDGVRISASKKSAFIQSPSHLIIESKLDKKIYRPGDRARLTLQIKDSRTQKGVVAALGLHGVDQSLLSLIKKRDDLRVFFSLPAYALKESKKLSIQPNRKSLADWILSANSDPRAKRAMEVLLAAVSPHKRYSFESSPWIDRENAWEEQLSEIVSRLKIGVETLTLGIRTSKGWAFHPDFVKRLVKGKILSQRYLRDPWQRIVRPKMISDSEYSNFEELATEAAPIKLDQLYLKMKDSLHRLDFKYEKFKGISKKYLPVIIPSNFIATMKRRNILRATELYDPWGYRFRRRKLKHKLLQEYKTGLISRYEIFSVGPDGRENTEDDIVSEGERWFYENEKELAKLLDDLEKGRSGYGFSGHGSSGGTIGCRHYHSLPKISEGKPLRRRRKLSRTRSHFPETLLWKPEVITDKNGKAEVSIPLSDSITQWRIQTYASSLQGQFGVSSTLLNTFKPLFIRPKVPEYLSEGDQITIPVMIRNYTKKNISLELFFDSKPGLMLLKSPSKVQLTLKPSASMIHRFHIKADQIGTHKVLFGVISKTKGKYFEDKVEKTTEILPDGKEISFVINGSTQATEKIHRLNLPPKLIDRSLHAHLSLQPGPLSEIQKGLAGLLKEPIGCFEQTSSALYPNIMILDYLKTTKEKDKQVEKKALRFIRSGYQRLLSFEVKGGGFSYYGEYPANLMLTAYGLKEFHDLSRFTHIDSNILDRTMSWLIDKEHKDGSWSRYRRKKKNLSKREFLNNVQLTAYIANIFAQLRPQGKTVKRANRFIVKYLASLRDPYTLSLIARFFATTKQNDKLNHVLNTLWKIRLRKNNEIRFLNTTPSLTYSSGITHQIETIANCAIAMIESGKWHQEAHQLNQTLIKNRDKSGAWHSTQATILALRALTAKRKYHKRINGTLAIKVDGYLKQNIHIKKNRQGLYQVNLDPFLTKNSKQIAISFKGKGVLQYQIAGSYWSKTKPIQKIPSNKDLRIDQRVEISDVELNDKSLRLRVTALNKSDQALNMPMIIVPLPPGLSISGESLAKAARKADAKKVELRNYSAVFYFAQLGANEKIDITLNFRAHHPLRVKQRAATIYEYYTPEHRAESKSLWLELK